MDFKVVFRDSFIADLEGLVRSVAQHDPPAARRLGERIIAMSESLSFFPERFPRVLQRLAVRRFIINKYFKVFYRIQFDCNTVEILRCWDGRRGINPDFRSAG